jgi:hypothetical protein
VDFIAFRLVELSRKTTNFFGELHMTHKAGGLPNNTNNTNNNSFFNFNLLEELEESQPWRGSSAKVLSVPRKLSFGTPENSPEKKAQKIWDKFDDRDFALPTGSPTKRKISLSGEDCNVPFFNLSNSPNLSPQKTSSYCSPKVSPEKGKKAWWQASEESDDFSTSSENFSSAENSPVKKGNTTPIRKMFAFLRDEHTDSEANLTVAEKSIIREGLEKVKNLPDTPNSKKRATQCGNLIETALGPVDENVFQVEYHDRVHKKLKNSPWLPSFANTVSTSYHACEYKPEGVQVPKTIVNIEHTFGGERRDHEGSGGQIEGFHIVGRHYVAVNDPLRSELREVVVNPHTGVFCAKFPKGNGDDKFSSFFPDSIQSQQDLLHKLFCSSLVARKNNSTLNCIFMNGFYFLVKQYLQAGGFIVQSAFPIFFDGRYEENAQFTITQNLTLSAADALFCAQSLVNKSNEAIEFIIEGECGNEDLFVIDIAPAITNLTGGISQGIYIFFPVDVIKI